MDVKTHQVEDFLVRKGRKSRSFACAADGVFGELNFGGDHEVDALFDGAFADKLVDHDVFVLSDAKSTVSGLVFDGRIPPSIEMDDMVGGGEVKSSAAGFDGENHEGRAVVGLESIDQALALFADANAAVQMKAGLAKDGGQVFGDGCDGFLILSKDKQAAIGVGDLLSEFAEHLDFAAVGGAPRAIAKKMGGMVADLFKPGESRDDDAMASKALGLSQIARDLFDAALIESALASRERAKFSGLNFLG